MSNKPSNVLKKLAAYEAANISTQPLYDEWSQTYEQDLVGNLGYTGHLIAARALAEFAPDKAASIIDIGCGTGLVGQTLKTLSYSHIDGIDFSEKMLKVARPKGVAVQRHYGHSDALGNFAVDRIHSFGAIDRDRHDALIDAHLDCVAH